MRPHAKVTTQHKKDLGAHSIYVWWLTGTNKYAPTLRYVSEYTIGNTQGGHQAHNTDTRLKHGLGFQNGPDWCHDEDTNPSQHKTHYHTTQHSHQTTWHSHLLTMTGFTGIPIKTFNTLETLTIIAVNEWPKTKIMFLEKSKNNFLTKFSRIMLDGTSFWYSRYWIVNWIFSRILWKYLITSNTDSFAKNLHISWTSVLILIKDLAPKAMNVDTNEDKP